MNRQYIQTNEQLEHLCAQYNVPIKVRVIDDQNAPKFQSSEDCGFHMIILNVAKIPMAQYESVAGYHVRKILLPKLRLETERLILRRFHPKDALDCFAFLSDVDGSYMDCCKAFSSMDEEYFEVMKFYSQQETRYMIMLKETGQVILLS